MKYKIHKRHRALKTWYIFAIITSVLVFLSISYAMFSTTLRINGTAIGQQQQFSIIYVNIPNSSSYPDTVGYMDTFTYTFTNPPTIESVSMGGIELTLGTDYTYTNGTLTIPDVTGALLIDGEQSTFQEYSIKYCYGDNIIFDGQTVLNTDIALFSSENFDRDFELTVDIDSSTFVSAQTYNTIFNCVDHDNQPYNGVLLRRNANNFYFKRTNDQNQMQETSYPINNIQSVKLVRTNKVLYVDFNNSSTLTQTGDFSNLNQTTEYAMLFGADLQSANKPFRYLTGELSNITITNKYDASEKPITLPLPSRTGYVFKGWYADPNFTQKVGNGGQQFNPHLENTTLYAKWLSESLLEEEEEYTFDGQYNFAQHGYIDTSVYLYTQTNIHRNFEMSFNINSLGSSANNDTLMSATKNVVRIKNIASELLTLDTIGNTATSSVNNIPNTITNIRIIRISDKLYYSLNGQTFLEINNYTNYVGYSANPVLFGADFDSNGNVYRNFDGILSDMSVKFISDSATLADYNPPAAQLATVYSHSGNYVFDGTNNIDTNIRLFDYDTYSKDFEISFNIVDIDSSVGPQAAFVNSKYENKNAGYPGFVYRLNANKDKIELTAAKATSGSPVTSNVGSVQSVKISRRSMKLYIQINNGNEVEAYNFTGFKDFFSTHLTIGSATDSNGDIFRPFIGTLSDIVVKMEQ